MNFDSLPKNVDCLDSKTLLEVINIQTEIVKMGVNLGNVMTLACERTQALTQAGAAVVELAEGTDMVYRAASGFAANQLGLRLKRDGSLSGLCVQLGEIMRCDDSETDARVDRHACRKVGLRSMLVVPLQHQGIAVGVLKVMAGQPNGFGDDDVRVLQLMSDLIAASMYNASKVGADQLYYQATHDAMTGLANRALFYDQLRQCLTISQRYAHQFAIINIDLDGLKPINDRYGHRAGDALICEAARRIDTISRKSDVAARMGGDEFAVLLTRVNGPAGVNAHCKRLESRIDQPLDFENHQLPLRASVGYSVFPFDGDEIDSLIEKADQVMYEAKRSRKSEPAPI
jgi:diguanylate cyclase (GGDEF)-like protein